MKPSCFNFMILLFSLYGLICGLCVTCLHMGMRWHQREYVKLVYGVRHRSPMMGNFVHKIGGFLIKLIALHCTDSRGKSWRIFIYLFNILPIPEEDQQQ